VAAAAGQLSFGWVMAGDHHAAQDIAQETMLRAWRRRKRLRDKRAAKRWLLTIAANIWRDQLRRRKTRPVDSMPASGDPPAGEASASHVLTRREAIELVKQRMAQLPPRQREVLYLRAFEKLSIEEIAGVLSISANAAKVSLSHARRTLRQALRQYDPAHEMEE
jgi:RNA polymerase sigma-70 factor (ECF subfamily)